ncbi:MAG: hypothetical protein LW700_11705 [Gemmataceae bacterium]|jgi:hypothetical protein|nr:hypothetical protein [Gemmataceae bacterium]
MSSNGNFIFTHDTHLIESGAGVFVNAKSGDVRVSSSCDNVFVEAAKVIHLGSPANSVLLYSGESNGVEIRTFDKGVIALESQGAGEDTTSWAGARFGDQIANFYAMDSKQSNSALLEVDSQKKTLKLINQFGVKESGADTHQAGLRVDESGLQLFHQGTCLKLDKDGFHFSLGKDKPIVIFNGSKFTVDGGGSMVHLDFKKDEVTVSGSKVALKADVSISQVVGESSLKLEVQGLKAELATLKTVVQSMLEQSCVMGKSQGSAILEAQAPMQKIN